MKNSRKNHKTLMRKFRDEIIEFLSGASIQGVPRIVKNARNKKCSLSVLWTLLFLCSCSYCAYTIADSIRNYFERPVKVNIQRIQRFPNLFPAISICNVNKFNDMLLIDKLLNLSELGKCFNKTRGKDFEDCTNGSIMSVYKTFSNQLTRVLLNKKYKIDPNYSQILAMIYFYLKHDMLISCEYNGDACDASNFTSYLDGRYGQCFTFNYNMSKPLYTSATVTSVGLELELVVIPPLKERNISYKSGIYLTVHNQTEDPRTMNTAIYVAPGFETHISVERQKTEKLSHPYSNCLIDLKKPPNDYAKRLFSYFENFSISYYDQNFCFSRCYQDKLMDTCGCQDFSPLPIISKEKRLYCENKTELECLKKFDNNFTTSDINKFCNEACPQECNTFHYILHSSMTSYPSFTYLKHLQTSKKYRRLFPNISDPELIEFARQGLVKVRVNNADSFYTLIKETPVMTLNDILGFLGGQLGLFVGISILGLAESLELMIHVITIWITHRKQKLIYDQGRSNAL